MCNQHETYTIIKREFRTSGTFDAELDGIVIIPQVLKDLPQERAIAVLEYLTARYKSGDNFGLK